MNLTLVALTAASIAVAVVPSAAGQSRDIGARLMQDPAVRAALDAARADEPRTIEDQIRICEIPAPPFKETARAKAYAEALRAAGLKDVRVDKEGNVIGVRPGHSARPNLVFSAHLDTVFPEETSVKVTRKGSMLHGPGIGDDCRGLAVLLSIVRALDSGKVQTPGTITFVGTVGEEGLGDLRGVKALFNDTLKGQIDRFVSVDSSGMSISHIAVGSLRYRVTFKGPGGHSYAAFGIANPVHALGRAIDAVADLQVPATPKTTFNVGRIGGGTSVNAIAAEAWMEVDMRSTDEGQLRALEGRFLRAVDQALAAENARWNQNRPLTVEKALVGNRPAGSSPVTSSIVETAVAVTKALGLPVLLDEGSTDSNVPMSLKISAVTIDGGGRGTGSHSLEEAFDTTNSWQGTQRALLLAVALAQ
jgi:acetylornithine deacetylase/succinyl-diaminopimelate desuccinylase-like protein